MSGVPQIEIMESTQELKELMKRQKNSLNFAKVQSLYLLKIQAVETVRHLAVIMGKGERTIHRWLNLYRTGGMEKLLTEAEKGGRPKKIFAEEAALVQNELRDKEGFESYKEIHFWLSVVQGIAASYITVYRLVKQELQSKLKVVRPKNRKQLPGELEEFKISLAQKLKSLLEKHKSQIMLYKKVRFWCQDESRFGLHTIVRRRITLKGVKPVGNFQYNFNYFWMYGLVSPQDGRSFFWEFSHLDNSCFNKFLSIFSQEFPEDIHIIQVDNAPAHTSGDLEVPDNIILFYQPPYCPEINPIERVWEYLKGFLSWETFESLDKLRCKVDKLLSSLSRDIIGSLTGWSWLLESLCVSGI